MHAIQATGLTKSFRDVHAVRGVDLTVEDGDVVGLLGPNGAGKTTTIMMLLGITAPDGGEVRLLGRRLPRDRVAALQRSNFAATYLGLPYRLTVREILRVYADLYGARRGRIDELIGMFEIESLAGRMPSDLSSGQQTLVILARSLLNRPRLLVLDEPTASLDPEMAGRVRRILAAEHAAEPFTILVTSHNMADIERLCRRVVFIARGRVVADGSPSGLTERYGASDLEETFLTIAAEARA
ncbi:MAG: ABC transporter ATP-binding protein [Acidobacteria bacterium]|nr:ABC transporter ATP-binding protein [Acidobacteriota bacterium]